MISPTKSDKTRNTKQYKVKRKQIQDQVEKLKGRGNNINTKWKAISDFEDGEFYGFSMILNKRKKIPRRSKKGNRK